MSPARKELQNQSSYFILGAIGVLVANAFITPFLAQSGLAMPVSPLFVVAALVLWIMGCIKYAHSKGYSTIVGLLGLLSIFGLLILVLLPNKWKDEVATTSTTNYPRPPLS